MDIYAQIAVKIIRSQENIIGPVAIEQAKKLNDIKVDWSKHIVDISGDEPQAIDQLITIYKNLFGQVSVEVSREAASALIGKLPENQVPASLK